VPLTIQEGHPLLPMMMRRVKSQAARFRTPKKSLTSARWVPLGRELLEISEEPSSRMLEPFRNARRQMMQPLFLRDGPWEKGSPRIPLRPSRAAQRRASIWLPGVAFHLITLPLFDCVDAKPPLASDAEPRQFSSLSAR
jgi:hypothetical protein